MKQPCQHCGTPCEIRYIVRDYVPIELALRISELLVCKSCYDKKLYKLGSPHINCRCSYDSPLHKKYYESKIPI